MVGQRGVWDRIDFSPSSVREHRPLLPRPSESLPRSKETPREKLVRRAAEDTQEGVATHLTEQHMSQRAGLRQLRRTSKLVLDAAGHVPLRGFAIAQRMELMTAAVRPSRPQLVDVSKFLLATRDTGYRSTGYAVAEFIDNAIQACATSVAVEVVAVPDTTFPLELRVTDNGIGMDEETLASALTFGGSSRFGDRSSLGRYGMGLPNGALSCARRVEVLTWRNGRVLTSRLDVDEMVGRRRRTLPPIEAIERPAFLPETSTGTAVVLRRCDRLQYRRVSTLVSKLTDDLGRIYRRFIDAQLDLRVNGSPLDAGNPLLLARDGGSVGSRYFGERLRYAFDSPGGVGTVEVSFVELPIDRWHGLSTDEKRRMGVTNAPSISIMRANREIDRGWYFMGAKRRENYDDWWRCEINFEPTLDELFGITNAKQGISPHPELLAALECDLEPIARALNSRVRRRFELVKATKPLGEAERQAARAEHALPALPRRSETLTEEFRQLMLTNTRSRQPATNPYQIIVTELPTTAAFDVVRHRGQLVLLFNTRHPLYRDLYGPLAMSDSEKDQETAKRIALAVLAAARAEESSTRPNHRDEVRRFRQAWADVLATFFNA
jgi:hypothetical protein